MGDSTRGEGVPVVPVDARDAFLNACHEAAARRLIRCSSGNLSCRLNPDWFLATASRSWLENITAEQIAVCRLSDGKSFGGPRPTVEIAFHAEILRRRPDVNVVLHFQTTFATTLACRNTDPASYFVIPEIPFYMGPIARVPYLPPGTPELAKAVSDAMQDHDMALMSNHGLVTVARDYAHAIQNAEFFELACEIIVRGGPDVAPLPDESVRDLLAMRRDAMGRV